MGRFVHRVFFNDVFSHHSLEILFVFFFPCCDSLRSLGRDSKGQDPGKEFYEAMFKDLFSEASSKLGVDQRGC